MLQIQCVWLGGELAEVLFAAQDSVNAQTLKGAIKHLYRVQPGRHQFFQLVVTKIKDLI